LLSAAKPRKVGRALAHRVVHGRFAAMGEAASEKRRGSGRRVLVVCGVAVLPVLAVAATWLGMKANARSSNVSVEKARATDVAMILGAGITADRRPSDVLQARIERGVELYTAGKVRKLVMSGDNSRENYDEVSVMKREAVRLGVPRSDVILDYAGFRTLDSCVRLRKVFGQSHAIVVSQGFHLPRAIHLCRWAGIDIVGVEAKDPRAKTARIASSAREAFASLRSFADMHIFGTKPRFGGSKIDVFNPPPEALEQPSRLEQLAGG
jgi:vancomycin permeability regulator SanA